MKKEIESMEYQMFQLSLPQWLTPEQVMNYLILLKYGIDTSFGKHGYYYQDYTDSTPQSTAHCPPQSHTAVGQHLILLERLIK